MTRDEIERVLQLLPRGYMRDEYRRLIADDGVEAAIMLAAFAAGQEPAKSPKGILKLNAEMTIDSSFTRSTTLDRRRNCAMELRTISYIGEPVPPVHSITVRLNDFDISDCLADRVRVTLEFYTPDKEPG